MYAPTAFHSPPKAHSEQPEEFYTIADRLGDTLGGPKLELFARQARPGWVGWGAEAGVSV
jgi:N6-adenosine-specific RNA methylase IME4